MNVSLNKKKAQICFDSEKVKIISQEKQYIINSVKKSKANDKKPINSQNNQQENDIKA